MSTTTPFFWEYPHLKKIYSVYLLLLAIVTSQCQTTSFSAERCGSAGVCEFYNLVIEQETNGKVYIGARNYLYQLNNDLEDAESVDMCSNNKCVLKNGESISNINKVLLIDDKNGRIVVCGSGNNGKCELRQQGDLSTVIPISSRNYYCVAAIRNLSTVAFLYRNNPANADQSMYVGATTTNSDSPRYEPPATISRRQLPQQNGMRIFSVPYSAKKIEVRSDYSDFRINFLEAFSWSDVGYFIANHPYTETNLQQRAYISQICLGIDSIQYSSYLEFPLSCKGTQRTYTKAIASRKAKIGSTLASALGLDNENVVFVSFALPEQQSAVCMYSQKDIEQHFHQILKDCINIGSGSQIAWLGRAGSVQSRCETQGFTLQDRICETDPNIWDIVHTLKGDSPLVKDALYENLLKQVTAIEVTPVNNQYTVAFFGTRDGSMLKLRLDGGVGTVYDEIQVDDAHHLSAGLPSDDGLVAIKQIRLSYNDFIDYSSIYVMSSRLVKKLPLFNCQQYSTCNDCLQSNDPFCGWCTLQSRCTARGKCERSSEAYQFITSTDTCPTVTSLGDELLQSLSQKPKMLSLKVCNIPRVADSYNQYTCRFYNDEDIIESQAESHPSIPGCYEIECETPNSARIHMNPNQGDKSLELRVVYGDHRKLVASTQFVIYKCNVHTSCVPCTGSGYKCVWCQMENKCYDNLQTKCSVPSQTYQNANNCPAIDGFAIGEKYPYQEIGTTYIHHGAKVDVTLEGSNLPTLLTGSQFQCDVIYNNGDIQQTSADIDASQLTCRNVNGRLIGNNDVTQASLRVLWISREQHLNVSIDQTIPLKIEVYKCIRDSCGSCLQSNPLWKCGWCESTTMCTMRRDCQYDWLQATSESLCRNPKIYSFSPSTAPIAGNTIIEINGENFGEQMKVTVADVDCVNIKLNGCCRLTCSPRSLHASKGKISLCITAPGGGTCIYNSNDEENDDYHAESIQDFQFVDPQVKEYSPTEAINGWGNMITLNGNHLNAGNTVTVVVHGQPCIVDKSTITYGEMKCRLPCADDMSYPTVGADSLIEVTFDTIRRLAVRRLNTVKSQDFQFVPSPTVDNIYPQTSILSGGLPIYLNGSRLHMIPNPKLKVTVGSQTYTGDCMEGRRDNSPLICFTPNIRSKPRNHFVDVDKVLIADMELVSVLSTSQNCNKLELGAKLKYRSDPIITPLQHGDNPTVFRQNEINKLYIKGRNLCPDPNYCSIDNVQVSVGDVIMKTDRLLDDEIICLVPEDLDIKEYNVKIAMGGYSEVIGVIEIQPSNTTPFEVIVACIIVSVLLTIGVTVVVCVYRRRVKERDAKLDHKQVEMDDLERKVANICKQNLYELQTNIKDLDIQSGGTMRIPYRDYRTYLMRVLFPEPSNYDRQTGLLLSTPQMERYYDPSSGIRGRNGGMFARSKNMEHLKKIIQNKSFLITLIRTLEAQRTFTMKDKANFSGLLLIVLHDELAYATEILEHLLAELIRKSFNQGQNPKLLFRRTESVAEKLLTHWFSVLLHPFILDCAGDPLFQLFRAIRAKLDQGPIDQVTSEAKNSLSEDNLMRISMETKLLTLKVTNYMSDQQQDEFAVRVLSCDSISQVKRKILDVCYSHHPYSIRPKPDQVDIQWRSSNGQGLVIRDEDHTCVIEGEWKRINTLQHYNVQDGAQISVIPKHEQATSRLNQSLLSSQSKHSGSMSRIIPLIEGSSTSLPRYHQHRSRSGTPTLPPDGSRLWHLVKPVGDVDPRYATGDSASTKMVLEVYLLRLLTTKGTLQKYVDDLFEIIFSVQQRSTQLPYAIKYMFDFLDMQASRHNVTDPEVLHTWKTNFLPLRFWVNLIKNPEFVYDIDKSAEVDSCLSVIGQAFMDSCSTTHHQLSSDSPTNKILYAKNIPNYQTWVKRYFADISRRPRINPKDSIELLHSASMNLQHEFNTQAALSQIFHFIDKYSQDIRINLRADPQCQEQYLSQHIDQILRNSNGAGTV